MYFGKNDFNLNIISTTETLDSNILICCLISKFHSTNNINLWWLYYKLRVGESSLMKGGVTRAHVFVELIVNVFTFFHIGILF